MRPTKIPYFIEQLEQHEFTPAQKKTIGALLKYTNELESQ